MAKNSSKTVQVPPSLPKPVGDPAAMEAMIAGCEHAASVLRNGSRSTITALASMDFHGLAAKQLRGVSTGNAEAAERSAEALAQFAHDLRTGMQRLQGDLADYHRREEQRKDAIDHNIRVRNRGKNPVDAAEAEFGPG